MLTTETYTLDDEIATIADRIETYEEELGDLDEDTDKHAATKARRDRLRYLKNGLEWQRDEEGWGDAEIELGAMTAGEEAVMHREAPDNAERDEMRLWFVAASTESAPYEADGLEETFTALAAAHPAFVEWTESKTNSLGVAGGPGNESSTSLTETTSEPSETSKDEADSTTTSSSDSPTA